MIVGIGNRARQGKDTVAKMVQELTPECKIIHFSDGLYQEVSTPGPPLILYTESEIGRYYLLRSSLTNYDTYHEFEVPKLHNIFLSRGIHVYDRMHGKDGEMLQFWGTDYRRKFYGEDYWIKKLAKNLKVGENYIIPDTRFINEYEFLKKMQGIYVSVKRYIGDMLYVDPTRDSRHISETELDGVTADFEFKILNDDFSRLKEVASEVNQLFK